jgi:cation diffusion facilitator CzcD-associated flavoprotein CzcO
MASALGRLTGVAKMDVAVIGAGVLGLSTALELARGVRHRQSSAARAEWLRRYPEATASLPCLMPL